MIKLRKDCVSLPAEKRVDYYDKPPDDLNKSADGGGHWVTVKAEGPLHGRHLFIGDDGQVLKGKGIPAHVVDHLNSKAGKGHLKDAEKVPDGRGAQPTGNFGFEEVDNRNGTMHFVLDDVEGLEVKFFATAHVNPFEKDHWKIPREPKEQGKVLSPTKKGIKDGRKVALYSIALDNYQIQISANGRTETLKIYHGDIQWTKPYHMFIPDKGKYAPVTGQKVGVHPDLHTFLHKSKDQYAVTEASTGLRIGAGSDKLAAIAKGKQTIETRGIDKIKQSISDHKQKHGAAPGFEEAAPPPEPPVNESKGAKLYHATHENDLKFGARDVKNYQSIGSWFSSDPKKANELYGPNVHEAHVELKNPLVTSGDTAEDFFDFFYSPTLAKKYLTKQERDRWDDNAQRKLLTNTEYMTTFKNNLVKQGYDGVTFKNSTIDLKADGSEGRHDVHIAFHPEAQVKAHRRMDDDELNKSFLTVEKLKQWPHALVIPRKVAPVQVEPTKADDIEGKHLTVYHTTPARNVASIRQSGLIPRHGKPTQGENPAYNAVYFHTDKGTADTFDFLGEQEQEPKTVLRVKIPLTSETARRLRPDEDTFHKTAAEAVKAKSSIAYCGTIPPEWIM